MLKNIVKTTFLLYVVCMFTLAEHEGTTQYANLAFALFALASMLYMIRDLRIKVEGPLPFILFALIAAISLIWTPDRDIAMTRVTTIFLLILLVFFVYNDFDPEESEFIIFAVWLGGTVLAFWFLSYYGFSGIMEGFTLGTRVGEEIAAVNSISRDMAIYIAVNVFLIEFYGKKFCILTLLMGFIVLLSTQSRSGLFCAIAGCIILVFFLVKEKKRYIIVVGGILIALAIFMNYLQSTDLYDSVFRRLLLFTSYLNGDRSSTFDASTDERFSLVGDGLALFKSSPIFGYGIASCYSLTGNTYFHNNLVQLLVEVGVVGFLPYYSFHISKLKIAILNIRDNINRKYNILALTLLVMLIVLDFSNATYYHKPQFLVFALVMVMTKYDERIELKIFH